MSYDYFFLKNLREQNVAWKLLCSQNSALILAFLFKAFEEEHRSRVEESKLIEILKNIMYELREHGIEDFKDNPLHYLNDWTSDNQGYLKRSYLENNRDEPVYDITPLAQKAINFIRNLELKSFVATESKLWTIMNLLKDVRDGTQGNPKEYIKTLKKQREELDKKIELAENGHIERLSDQKIRDRFFEYISLADGLTSQFRDVRYNFEKLDRKIREDLIEWNQSKGDFISSFMNESDRIDSSDQGKSVESFFNMLIAHVDDNSDVQAGINYLYSLDAVKDAIKELKLDNKRLGFYRTWLNSAKEMMDVKNELTKRIKQFIDDRNFSEAKGILKTITAIEGKLIKNRELLNLTEKKFYEIDNFNAEIILPLEKELYQKKVKVVFDNVIEEEETHDDTELFMQAIVSREEIYHKIISLLSGNDAITLKSVIDYYGLKYGIAELVIYVDVIKESFNYVIFEDSFDEYEWLGLSADKEDVVKRVKLEHIIIKAS